MMDARQADVTPPESSAAAQPPVAVDPELRVAVEPAVAGEVQAAAGAAAESAAGQAGAGEVALDVSPSGEASDADAELGVSPEDAQDAQAGGVDGPSGAAASEGAFIPPERAGSISPGEAGAVEEAGDRDSTFLSPSDILTLQTRLAQLPNSVGGGVDGAAAAAAQQQSNPGESSPGAVGFDVGAGDTGDAAADLPPDFRPDEENVPDMLAARSPSNLHRFIQYSTQFVHDVIKSVMPAVFFGTHIITPEQLPKRVALALLMLGPAFNIKLGDALEILAYNPVERINHHLTDEGRRSVLQGLLTKLMQNTLALGATAAVSFTAAEIAEKHSKTLEAMNPLLLSFVAGTLGVGMVQLVGRGFKIPAFPHTYPGERVREYVLRLPPNRLQRLLGFALEGFDALVTSTTLVPNAPAVGIALTDVTHTTLTQIGRMDHPVGSLVLAELNQDGFPDYDKPATRTQKAGALANLVFWQGVKFLAAAAMMLTAEALGWFGTNRQQGLAHYQEHSTGQTVALYYTLYLACKIMAEAERMVTLCQIARRDQPSRPGFFANRPAGYDMVGAVDTRVDTLDDEGLGVDANPAAATDAASTDAEANRRGSAAQRL